MTLSGDFAAAMVDLDGTMVDTLGDFVASLDRAFAESRRAAVSPAVVSHLVGKGGEHLVRGALLSAGLDEARVDALADDALLRYRRHYDEINGRYAKVYPGVAEGLQRLRDHGLRLACVTNKPTAPSRELLRITGLDRHFDVVAGGDRFERLKPDPMPLLQTCAELGTEPARTLMIGDSLNDALAARAAGCPVVLVTYGFNHGRPVRDVDADGYADSIDDLAFA